jgi:predicted DNA-binding WGR domain protein
MSQAGDFFQLLERGEGTLQTDDVLTAILPLFREVSAWHDQDLVAQFNAVTSLTLDEAGALHCICSSMAPIRNSIEIDRLQSTVSKALNVVGHGQFTSDDELGGNYSNLDVVEGEQELKHPVYLTDYRTWEQQVGHHDALTDIMFLGQLFASLALGLNFTDVEDLKTFANSRTNLFRINSRLHPVLASIIVEMTELSRHKRASDLKSLVVRLENYRDQVLDLDVSKIPGFNNAGLSDRRKLVHTRLRDRLFEISRRNRMLYFKPSQASLNLTVASVPLVLHITSIKIEQLFVWQKKLAEEIAAGKPLNLGRWLRFEDQPYLPSALDKLISDARRDRAEYGFAQLRLVAAFLHWHNLKESPNERISSPLLLLPIELSKKKGVKDQYNLTPLSAEAEVNPVLRHCLQQLYGLHLPEKVDLNEVSLEQFHRDLEEQIHASEPAVKLKFVDKPEIELIHERAKQRLARYQRKQKIRTPVHRTNASFGYSYSRDNLSPLGLKLFLEKIKPKALPQRAAAGGLLPISPPQAVPSSTSEPIVETERQTFAITSDQSGNPYTWEFDLCSLTVSNFNYRKMSLVRDYSTLLDGELSTEAFDRVFSLEPKALDESQEQPAIVSRADGWSIVAGDATQSAAVSLARTGANYIIQGPPGTGKSQTITNLIADYVARGKTVLFVCEKRAAIDVVFHRLRQRGLDELCCLIHDSQADKKSFVLNLKQTYEGWIAKPDELTSLQERRASLIQTIDQDARVISRFDQLMRSIPEHVACAVRQLIHRLVELREFIPQLEASLVEQLPDYSIWRAHDSLARRFASLLSDISNAKSLASHPFRWLGPGVIGADRPLHTLNELSDRAETLLNQVESAFLATGLAREYWDTIADIDALTSFCDQVSVLAARNQLQLLDPKSKLTSTFEKSLAALGKLELALKKSQQKTNFWKEKLSSVDVSSALVLVKANENSFLRWVKPSWWKLKSLIEERYDFSQHALRPTFLQILTDLEAEHAAANEYELARQQVVSEYGDEPSKLLELVIPLRSSELSLPALVAMRQLLLQSSKGVDIVQALQKLGPSIKELLDVCGQLLDNYRSQDLSLLGEIIRDLREESDSLPELIPLLAELADTPPAFAHALRTFDLLPDQIEAAVAQESLEKIYRGERWLPKLDGRVFNSRAERLGESEREWMKENALVIRAEVHNRFREHVRVSSLSATQLDVSGKQFKKVYSSGRRDLEHEFGKTMRFKSIRDLIAGDSGKVVRDLKPVWLMSPLSVSDTLPLMSDLFDVVIFDEASQIPVEEAVPALYRAPQVIVVGDEMQLPPTNFFSSARDKEEDSFEVEEDGERVMISLESDSFLSQSTKNLPSTMLAWHYRSRSESLISFSNAAFYAGNLYTIPDRQRQTDEWSDIVVGSADDASENVEDLLTRPISFHFMEKSPYESRCNIGEAAYIAQLVAELLRRETKFSIGIVAFSEAQQSEIESALDALAATDSQLAARLDEEYAREEDDQFCGLIVKNLENVQGDERDIIILSVCYGPDNNGRMVMNFGPINQRGGEKRLNVIFSRARHHMAVVSSIKHNAITNDYNDGAAALKSYLHYAETSSRGEARLAQSILEGLNPLARKSLAHSTEKNAVVSQLAKALRQRGLVVDEKVGQSRFRCDLAVCLNDDSAYRVGVVIDTLEHYANADVLERYVTQPGILRAFGWQVAVVLTRDWYHEPEAIIARIERALHGQTEARVELELDEPSQPSSSQSSGLVAPTSSSSLSSLSSSPSPVVGSAELISSPNDATGFRRFEFSEGNVSKFWQIKQESCNTVVQYGRIGTAGQSKTKSFDTPEAAAQEVEKLVREKLRKGYLEVA